LSDREARTAGQRASPRPRFWAMWLVLSAVALAALPTWTVYGRPLWTFHQWPMWMAGAARLPIGFLGAQILLGVLLIGSAARGRGPRLMASLALAGTVLGLLFLSVLVLGVAVHSRVVLLTGTGLVLGSALVPALWVRSRRAASLCATAVVLSAPGARLAQVGVGHVLSELDEVAQPAVRRNIIPASYYTLQAEYYDNFIPPSEVSGGALELLGDALLVMHGDGELFRVTPPSADTPIVVTMLGIRVPSNRDAFIEAAVVGVDTHLFRSADLLVEPLGERVRLIASHHYWKTDERCFVLRVSMLETSLERLSRSGDPLDWETVYDTKPCLAVADARVNMRGVPFAGDQSGGRLAPYGSEQYLLTVGDHQFDGWNRRMALSQAGDADYGKLLLVTLEGEAEVFSTGHRSPGGLHIAPDMEIWETEHGPQGGDELNRIQRGGNYGWPFVTLGTEYSSPQWPLTDTARQNLTPPMFSWVPSVGVSSVTSLQGPLFDRWRGDLLIASLKGETLFRAHMEQGRIVVVEPLGIGGRIRDLVEDSTGRIVLLLETGGDLVFLSPADYARDGAAIFAAQCSGCHSVDENVSSGIGPNLRNVFRRRVAWVDGYQYSEALQSLTGIWDIQALGAYLADPQEFAPGTSMQFDGVRDPAARQALIAHLERL
jgi:aldose sugar dehydrogenase